MDEKIINNEMENIDLRSENAKHFKDATGKATAIFYSEPVHYLEKNKFIEIDNELILDAQGSNYQNKRNRFKTKFAKDLLSNKIVEIFQDHYKVEIDLHKDNREENIESRNVFSFVKQQKRRINHQAVAQLINNENDKKGKRQNFKDKHEKKLTSRLKYGNFSENTDLEYQVVANKLKENIIISQPSDNYNFEFEIKLQNLTMKLAEDERSINLISKDTKESIFTIPAPLMYDAINETSNEFFVEIEELESNVYLYKLHPDAAWINAEERKYPVTIDPQIVSNTNDFIKVKNADANGKATTITIKNTVISKAFDKNTKIRSAVLELIKSYISSFSNLGYDVKVNGKIIDFFIQPGNKDKIQINLTEQLQYAIKNEINRNNENLLVEVCPVAGNNSYIKFMEESSATNANILSPKIMIDYVPEWRNIDDKSYFNFEVKKAGAANVNLVNGNLEFNHLDVATNSTILPLDIEHVYNNMAEGESFAFSYRNGIKKRLSSSLENPVERLIGFADGIDNYWMGKGWKLNIQQQLIKHNDEDNVLPNDRLTTYIDGEGNRHSFVEKYFYYEDDGKLKDQEGNSIGRKIYLKNEECILTETGDLIYKLTGSSSSYKSVLLTVIKNDKGEIQSFVGEYEGNKFQLPYEECRFIEYPFNYMTMYEASDKKYQVEIHRTADGASYSYILGVPTLEKEFKVHYEVSNEDGGLILDTVKSKVCYLSESGYFYKDNYYVTKDGNRYAIKKNYNKDYTLTMYYYNFNSNTILYTIYENTEYDFTTGKLMTKKGFLKDSNGNDIVVEVIKQEFKFSGDIKAKKFYYKRFSTIREEMLSKDDETLTISCVRNYNKPKETNTEILLKIEKSLKNEKIEALEERKFNLETQKIELKETFDEYEKEYKNTDELGKLLREKQEECYQENLEFEANKARQEEELFNKRQEALEKEVKIYEQQKKDHENNLIGKKVDGFLGAIMKPSNFINGFGGAFKTVGNLFSGKKVNLLDYFSPFTQEALSDTNKQYNAETEQLNLSIMNSELSRKQLEFENSMTLEANRIQSLQNVATNIEKAREIQADTERAEKLNDSLTKLLEKIDTINKQLEVIEKLLAELRDEEKKKAMDFITTSDGDTLGFDFYGRLVSFSDSEQHTCNIIYEDGKIIKVTDAENNEIIFDYYKDNAGGNKTGNLKTITDARGRITLFDYNQNGELLNITYPDGDKSSYTYESNKILKIIDSSGYGVKLDYNGSQVEKISEFTQTELISANGIELSSQQIEGEVTTLQYLNGLSSILTSKKNIKTAYVFDNNGSTVSIYDYDSFVNGVTPSEASVYSTNIYDMEVEEINKYTLSCDNNLNSKNILENTILGLAKFNKENYQNQMIDYQGLLNLGGNRNASYKINQTISSSDLGEIHDYYIFSGWGKSMEAFYTPGRASEFVVDKSIIKDIPELDDVQLERRFGLYAKVIYETDIGNPGYLDDKFYSPFDWQNKEWQYNALAIKIRRHPSTNKLITPKEIELRVEYSYNGGQAHFANICLNKCGFQYIKYNNERLPVLMRELNGDTTYEYNDKNLLVKTIYKDLEGKEYFANILYNSLNLPIYSEDYKGIVTENFYDANKKLTRSITYHKDEPANKFYKDKQNDDKGRLQTEYGPCNELGDNEGKHFEYHPKTSLVKSITDSQQNKTVYDYDYTNDTLTHISHSVNGLNNENIISYKKGYMTNVKHNETNFNYSYDGFGRIKQISIADKDYFKEIVYDKDKDGIEYNRAIFKTEQGFKTYYDKHGKIIEIYYIDKDASNGVKQYVKNVYNDNNQNLLESTEYRNKDTAIYKFNYDEFGNVVYKQEKINDIETVLETVNYDKYGKIKNGETIVLGQKITKNFTYDENFEPKIININTKNEDGLDIFNEKIDYDKQGRIAKHYINMKHDTTMVEEINYLKISDHATNLIKSINYSTNDKIKDRVSYNYDNNGNIIEVIENGYLMINYEYDSLCRLIRENNKKMGTFTYEYDNGGNIISKKKYAYTLDELPVIGYDNILKEAIEYTYGLNGWRDQLIAYNGKEITYDEIGNPREYRGKKFTWTHGRRLSMVEGEDSDGTKYNYKYNYNAIGIRTSKEINGIKTEFYLSGKNILVEKRENVRIDYLYGITGILGMKYNNNYYYYKKNQQDDIIGIIDSNGNFLVKYTYDAWGNHIIDDNSGIGLGNINPFRYRSYYYDNENGLYYLQSRYYDSQVGRFINADDLNYQNPAEVNGLNLYSYCNNNPINLVDPDGHFAFLAALFKVINVIVKIGKLIGKAIKAIWNAIRHPIKTFKSIAKRLWKGIKSIGQKISNLAKRIRDKFKCFKEGTLIHTEKGKKPIEEIKEGDLVWAYDDKTKNKTLKKVVKLFKNGKDPKYATADGGTMSWVHVSIGSETISSTPEHPYYILNTTSNTPIVRFEGRETNSTGSWVAAKDLTAGMKVLLSNGKYDTISMVEVEHLEQPETTYNFEVEDFHTYYVGSAGVLVHNSCGVDDIANVNPEKFSEYIFNPEYASNGKAAVFEGLGYSKGDAELLSQIYRTQGGSNYLSGNYTLGKLDGFGQRITIPIRLNGVGNAAGKISVLNSGWIVEGSKIRLVTPFAGFA